MPSTCQQWTGTFIYVSQIFQRAHSERYYYYHNWNNGIQRLTFPRPQQRCEWQARWHHHTCLPSIALTVISLAWRWVAQLCQLTLWTALPKTQGPLELFLCGEPFHPQTLLSLGVEFIDNHYSRVPYWEWIVGDNVPKWRDKEKVNSDLIGMERTLYTTLHS